jgi:hypothetical protein
VRKTVENLFTEVQMSTSFTPVHPEQQKEFLFDCLSACQPAELIGAQCGKPGTSQGAN